MGLSQDHLKEGVVGLPGHYRESLLPWASASQGDLAAPPLTLQNSSPHLTQAITRTSPQTPDSTWKTLFPPVAPGPPPPECPEPAHTPHKPPDTATTAHSLGSEPGINEKKWASGQRDGQRTQSGNSPKKDK